MMTNIILSFADRPQTHQSFVKVKEWIKGGGKMSWHKMFTGKVYRKTHMPESLL